MVIILVISILSITEAKKMISLFHYANLDIRILYAQILYILGISALFFN